MPGIEERPALLIANKMDHEDAAEKLAEFIEKTGETPLQVSAQEKTGLEPVTDALFELIQEHGALEH